MTKRTIALADNPNKEKHRWRKWNFTFTSMRMRCGECYSNLSAKVECASYRFRLVVKVALAVIQNILSFTNQLIKLALINHRNVELLGGDCVQ